MGDSNKRVRDDSGGLELFPPEAKHARVDSPEPLPPVSDDSLPSSCGPVAVQLDGENPGAERVDSDGNSFEEACIPDNLLDILDDAETAELEAQDLDSVIKSFEEEILDLPASGSDPDKSVPDLGYLLEASDDELGLPPTATTTSAASEFGPSDYISAPHMFGYQDEIPNLVSFGIGAEFGCMYSSGNSDGKDGEEFVMFDGLFDTSDYSEFLYRPESMPAS